MASATAADILVETIQDWGVEVVFGLPGDGINGIMEALRKRKDRVRFVQARHEEAAAFMACGYAKFTGQIGVCLATSGPGGIHLLNGLYDAKLDGQSVSAITGLQFHDLIGTYTQQDVALEKLFMDVAVFNERIMGPTHVGNITDLACRIALAYHGVSHITFPVDLQEKEVKDRQRSQRNVPHHTSEVYSRSARLPDQIDLEKSSRNTQRRQKGSHPCRSWGVRRYGRTRAHCGIARRPDYQSTSREGGSTRRQPLHHRWHWPARDQALPGGDGGLRHAADGWHFFPVPRVYAQTWASPRSANRTGSQAHWLALSGRNRVGGATAAALYRNSYPFSNARRTEAFFRRPRRR